MDKRTRKVTLAAVFTALAVVILLLSSAIPSGQLGFAAVASLFTAAGVIESGIAGGGAVFIGSSVLAALLVPNKSTVILYVVFFGYYPIIKSFCEKLRSQPLAWILKLLVLNAAFSAGWFLLKNLFFSSVNLNYPIWLIYIAVNIVFVIFDIGLSKLIGFYIYRVHRQMRR